MTDGLIKVGKPDTSWARACCYVLRSTVFLRVRSSILILFIKTVRCSIVRCSIVRCSIPHCIHSGTVGTLLKSNKIKIFGNYAQSL
jgi:hypothetical protein